MRSGEAPFAQSEFVILKMTVGDTRVFSMLLCTSHAKANTERFIYKIQAKLNLYICFVYTSKDNNVTRSK